MAARRRYTLAQKLRDPNKRKLLPMSALTPQQQAQRKARMQTTADNANPLYNPTAQLAGHSLISSAQQLAGLELDPQLRALDQQSGTVQTQGHALQSNASEYFKSMAAREAASLQAQQAISDRLNAQLGQVNSDAVAQTGRMQNDQQGLLAQDAATRGQGLDGGAAGRIAQEISARQGMVGASGQAYRSAGAMQGANAETLLNQLGSARQMHGGEIQGQLANRIFSQLSDLASKRTGVEAQRGPLTTKDLLNLRQSGFDNNTVTQGLDLKTTAAIADASQATSAAQSSRDKFIAEYGVSPETYRKMSVAERLALKAKLSKAGKTPPKGSTTDNYGYTQAEWNGMTHAQKVKAKAEWEAAGRAPKGGSPGSPGKTPKETAASNNAQASILNVQSKFVSQLLRDHPDYTRAQIVAHAHKFHPEINDVTLAAALDLTNHPGVGPGYITPRVRKLLLTVGVRVGKDGQLQ